MFMRNSNTRPWQSPRCDAPRGGTLAAIALIGATLAFAVAVAAAVVSRVQAPPRDPGTGCDAGAVQEHVSILIDQSDPVPDSELRVVRGEIERLARALPVGSRMTIRALAPEGDRLTRLLFDRCKPKDGSMVSRWTGNRSMQDKIHADEFARPLEQALERLATAEEFKTSPIIEALAAIAVDASFAKARRRVVVAVGDMLERSAILDMYRPGYSFAAVDRAGFKPVRDLKELLAGAEVVVLQVRRAQAGRFQTAAQREFWVALMTHAGVSAEQLRYDRL